MKDLLVTVRDESPSVYWYRNEGDNEFTGTALGTGTDGKAFAGDINGDGYVDIATAVTQGGEVTMQRWLNDGAGLFTSVTLATNTGVKSIYIDDVNGNGYQDIVTAGTAGLQRWDTDDGYTWNRVDIDDANSKQDFVTSADVNQDGKMDLVVGETDGDNLVYYRNQDGTTWQRIVITGAADAKTVVVKDLDEDGDEDFIVADQDGNRIRWYSQTGVDEFSASDLVTGLQSVYGVLVADLDGDNDFDYAAGDLKRGAVYWYERVSAKPVATAPSSGAQSSLGSGEVSFTTSISDEDKDETKIRVQYSLDGSNWYKPWITKAVVTDGKANLKNSDGYQVGTTNGIDTDDYDLITVTMKWDTKSIENTGGPIVDHQSNVKLRVIPRDGVGNGKAAISETFEIDNAAPKVGAISVINSTDSEMVLEWPVAMDGSAVTYKVYYGKSATAVINQTSEVWTSDDDTSLGTSEADGTTIGGLLAGTEYTFKLAVADVKGNSAVSKIAKGATTGEVPGPSPTTTPIDSGIVSVTPPPASSSPTPTGGGEEPTAEPLPSSIFFSPTPTAGSGEENDPIADAGEDQTVNAGALVILNGTGSADPDGDVLLYEWRQVAGATVNLEGADTATPSFTVEAEDESYVFQLTTTDRTDRADTDAVTIGVRPSAVGGEIGTDTGDDQAAEGQMPAIARYVLVPIDWLVLAIAAVMTLVLAVERIWRRLTSGRVITPAAGGEMRKDKHRGRLVHHVTGKPVLGAMIKLFDTRGNLLAKERADRKGEFALGVPPGEYTIVVKLKGFDFGSAAVPWPVDPGTIVYTGGSLSFTEDTPKVAVIIPMKPTGARVTSSYAQILQVWQFWQQRTHQLVWPLIILGAALNTWLLFWIPGGQFLAIELLYVGVVLVKILLEVKSRPSYGLVRDVVTHVPIDLAVVRLYEHGTNKLVMTRVSNTQGKFFGLPPSGTYTVTVSRLGYAAFIKQRVEITSKRDAMVQLKVDMMPVSPVLTA